MDQLFNNVLSLFDRYTEMQNAHLKAFKESATPDIQKQNFERAGIFEDLKNMLSHTLSMVKIKEDVKFAEICKNRLSSIIATEDIIKKQIDVFKNNIKMDMQKLNKGKKAMRGYNSLISTNAPRIVSKSG